MTIPDCPHGPRTVHAMTITPLFPIQGRLCDPCMTDRHEQCADESCGCVIGPHSARPRELTPIAAASRPDKPSALPKRRPPKPPRTIARRHA